MSNSPQRTPLVPRSLLPLIHDMLHHVPPLYFAELETLYLAQPDLPDRARVLLATPKDLQEPENGGRVANLIRRVIPEAWRGTRQSTRSPTTEYLANLRADWWGWMVLVAVRLNYLEHALPGVVTLPDYESMFNLEPSRVRKVLDKLPQLDLSQAEREHFAEFGAVLRPRRDAFSPDPPPPMYLPSRALSALNCRVLQTAVSYAGMPDAAERVRLLHERSGGPGASEDEWCCRHTQLPPVASPRS